MTENTLTEIQRDAAQRVGRIAALLVISMHAPEALISFPKWARECLRNIAEACAQGANEAIDDLASPLALGMGFGNVGMIASFIRRPEERWGASVREGIDVYWKSYFDTIKRGPA